MFNIILLRCYYDFISIVNLIPVRTVHGPVSNGLAQGIIKIWLWIIIDYYMLYGIANKLLGTTTNSWIIMNYYGCLGTL